jgi:hypothetical protein
LGSRHPKEWRGGKPEHGEYNLRTSPVCSFTKVKNKISYTNTDLFNSDLPPLNGRCGLRTLALTFPFKKVSKTAWQFIGDYIPKAKQRKLFYFPDTQWFSLNRCFKGGDANGVV